jgi:YceI-like domain
MALLFILSMLLAAPLSGNAGAESEQSKVTIHVFKSGIFSGFAHDHVVIAPITQMAVDSKLLTAEITIPAKEMKVVDQEVSDKDRAEIQSTMLGPKVLDAEKYPGVRFKSSRIEQTAPQRYHVTGTLELHGASKEESFDVTGSPAHYHGAMKLKQSDFGIKPISLFGGSVKVKDEIELEFDVYLPAAANE